jgi:hypothetical protein
MAEEKDDSGSKIGALSERIPIMDGSGRRRLTAGTLVVVTLLFLVPSIRDQVTEAIAKKDVSVTLILATGALLIYATGVIVELIGEIFLARAVANAAWGYSRVNALVCTWGQPARTLGKILVIPIWGTVRAAASLGLGLGGANRWRLEFRGLSPDARKFYDESEAITGAARHAIATALGATGEFGRKVLIDLQPDAESRTWARKLMERPKDMLALVSALIVCFLMFLAATPIEPQIDSTYLTGLQKARPQLEVVEKNLADELSGPDRPHVVYLALYAGQLDMLMNESRYHSVRDVEFALRELHDRSVDPCNKTVEKPYDASPSSPELRSKLDLDCDHLNSVASDITETIEAAQYLIHVEKYRRIVTRVLVGIGVLVLYVAFFNALSSATVSVIEAAAFAARRPGPSPPTLPG